VQTKKNKYGADGLGIQQMRSIEGRVERIVAVDEGGEELGLQFELRE